MELPQHFEASMKELLKDDYQAYLDSFKAPVRQGIRVNTSKISVEEFAKLAPFVLEPIPWVPNGFYAEADAPITKSPYYYAGLFYVQEPSAMLPASKIPVEPGDKILDLCAAPGGKATELGSRLKNKGLLVANDISASRAKGLLKNLELFGIGNMCVCSETPEKLLSRYGTYFDKILIDAPCSGEGMFRKDPSMLKSYQEHGPKYYAAIQRQILDAAYGLLKPGGWMLYSTCTFSQLENECTIYAFLTVHPDMECMPFERCEGMSEGILPQEMEEPMESLRNCARIFPHKAQGEGHFAALLHKRSDVDSGKQKKETSPAKAKMEPKPWTEFKEQCLKKSFEGWSVFQLEEKLYAYPEDMDPQKGIRYLRTGLYLGECKKNRFEPSQALAMHLTKEEAASTLSLPLPDERIRRYLKGETIELTEKESAGLHSWTLVCVDGFPLGWAKWAGNSLKNKYYPGWRIQ